MEFLKNPKSCVPSWSLWLIIMFLFTCCTYFYYATDFLVPTDFEIKSPQQNSLEDVIEILDDGEKECDFFEGEWVWDESYPLYESRNCEFLREAFRCSENGRPNNSYAKWRWQPKNCNLPRFNAVGMLEKLRNRRLVFVGDSTGRNQLESLLCMLSSEFDDLDEVYEVKGRTITEHNGFLIFEFEPYNCTVEYYRSPFLVLQSQLPSGAAERGEMLLKLDVMDSTSEQWRDADVLIFNTGYWWNHDKIKEGNYYFQIGDDVKMNMSIESAYSKSIETLVLWIKNEVDFNRTQVIFRTYAPAHNRGGDWKTGGRCDLEIQPETSSSSMLASPSWAHLLYPITDVLFAMDPKMILDLDIMDVTKMSALRPDGHPSLYYLGPTARPAALSKQDCSHWCLPGVPDAWNELLYALIVNKYLLL